MSTLCTHHLPQVHLQPALLPALLHTDPLPAPPSWPSSTTTTQPAPTAAPEPAWTPATQPPPSAIPQPFNQPSATPSQLPPS